MNLSTASARLKRKMLFRLVGRAGRDACFRCQLPIEEVAHLSVDHIEPWRGVSADLFWELSNISFSHSWCNTAHHRYVPRGRVAQTNKADVRSLLGMPIGTASARLLKRITLDLLQSLGEGACFRCNDEMDVDTLSLDHTVPWIDVDPAIFWDLDLVSFAHRRCNSAAVRREYLQANGRRVGALNLKVCPPGLNWCAAHQDFVAAEAFAKNKTNPVTGLQSTCSPCRSAKRRRIPLAETVSDLVTTA